MKRTQCIVLVLAALVGCARRETNVDAGLRTQTLHLGNEAEPANLDPHGYTLMAEWMILTSLYEGLVNLANDGTTILPGVAERWEISPDGLAYTFHLRANARWSNGEAVTANDFVESFRRMLDPAVGCTTPEYAFPISGAEDYYQRKHTDFSRVGMRAPDPRTLQFTLAYRWPYFLTSLTNTTQLGMPLHFASLDKLGSRSQRGGKWTLPGNLVSNGPFVLKEWRPNQVLVVVRNEHYWGAAKVRLKEVHFHPAEDTVVEERAYRARQLHVTSGLPPNKVEYYRSNHPDEFQQAPLLHTHYLTFNCARAPFSDPRVRRALALAIDRKVVTEAGFRGRGVPARSLTRPGTGGFEPPELKVHDVAEAQRALSDAGFPGGKGFPSVEFRLVSGRSDITAIGETLQQMWKQVLGVHIPLRQMETKSLIASMQARDFELGLSGFYYIDEPSDLLSMGEKESPRNFAGWQDAEFEAAVGALRRANSDADRLSAFATMERRIAQEAPYVPLLHSDRARLVHPVVRGWRENKMVQIDWRELWLEAK